MDQVVLVKGWKKGANWSFPRGKINKDEPDLDCAIREVYEETGYDIKAADLTGMENEKYIEMNLREQHMRLYVFRGIPMDTYFEPRTRKEISKVSWWKLADLPTLKKKKQQQEGKGEDLAINANKFYMVAPFLPQLKKWIGSQKNSEKDRQTSQPVISDNAKVNPAQTRISSVPSSNHDLTAAINKLRQSATRPTASDLPEVSEQQPERKDLGAQLMALVGAGSVPSTAPQKALDPLPHDVPEKPNANSLLSLFKNKAPSTSRSLPRTPMEQVIEHPPMPQSPPHPNNQSQLFSSMAPPPTFPLHGHQSHVTISKPPQPPLVRSIPPPQQPAQLVPRAAYPQQQGLPSRANPSQRTIAPYQRTGDPQFAQHAQVPGNQPPSIPPASKLPAPKLTAQSSALLSLFKSHSAEPKTPVAQPRTRSPSNPVAQAATAAGLTCFGKKLENILSNVNSAQAPLNQNQTYNSKSAFILVPSQVSPGTSSAKATDTEPIVEQKDALLSLFRKPIATKADSTGQAQPSLDLPSAAVELSALPSTPGRSKETSGKKQPTNRESTIPVYNGPVKIQKRPQEHDARGGKPSVSATINGPLNVPQFDMVAKTSRDGKQTVKENGHVQPQKRSPVTILARPRSQNAPLPKQSLSHVNLQDQQLKPTAPKLNTLITPTKDPPPTPNLRGQEIPTKPFHPQIIRRTGTNQDVNEPSPIQPLPSPKHGVPANHRSAQPPDHRKSLLSLFINSPPPISPPSAAPVSAIDPTATFDPSSLISPISKTPTPQEQAEAAFEQLSKNVGRISHPEVPHDGVSKPEVSSMSSINYVLDDATKESSNDSAQQATRNTAAPLDKKFLLGYLEGVAKGGR
ncbi:mRNA-decapping enzyme subunit 2 [Puttea exsequens]|nr:mRNA-decapping enzyme subunit 2 [Puttea exsequens]